MTTNTARKLDRVIEVSKANISSLSRNIRLRGLDTIITLDDLKSITSSKSNLDEALSRLQVELDIAKER
jgi:hypothetical protein